MIKKCNQTLVGIADLDEALDHRLNTNAQRAIFTEDAVADNGTRHERVVSRGDEAVGDVGDWATGGHRTDEAGSERAAHGVEVSARVGAAHIEGSATHFDFARERFIGLL